MYLIIQKASTLKGSASIPGSKSQTIRGLLLALLTSGESTLINPLRSEDTQEAIRICETLGAVCSIHENQIKVRSPGLLLKTKAMALYTGNSGITTRFVLPLLGFRENVSTPIILDCGAQMRERPIHALVEALRSLGLHLTYTEQEGRLPLSVVGPLQGGTAEVSGLTSQYISALLLALPCAPKDSTITVHHLNERPYVDMTLQWLTEQNITYTHQKNASTEIYHIPGNQRYHPLKKIISGDFSSASYLIAAAVLLEGQVELKGLDMNDPQGDKRLVNLLIEMGADMTLTPHSLLIRGGSPLKGLSIDANDIPDLLPTLAVIGTYASGKTELLHVPQARFKETDRIHSMSEGLKRLGAHLEERREGLIVYQSHLKGARVKGYGDHRTVMALALAGLLSEGITCVEDAQAIDKTFPSFVTLLRSLGAPLEVRHEAPF